MFYIRIVKHSFLHILVTPESGQFKIPEVNGIYWKAEVFWGHLAYYNNNAQYKNELYQSTCTSVETYTRMHAIANYLQVSMHIFTLTRLNAHTCRLTNRYIYLQIDRYANKQEMEKSQGLSPRINTNEI